MRPSCLFRSALVFALAVSAIAAPHSTTFITKETVDLPSGWSRCGTPPSDHVISLRIGLPQPNFPVLEKHLYEISDPEHPRYGLHFSKEQVEELVAPHPGSLDAVNNWLATHGFGESNIVRSPAKDWISINIPVNLVEKMLDTVGSNRAFFLFLTGSNLCIRNITFTSTKRVAITSCERQATACLSTCTFTLT
jgi:tripeptidyl-peptidase-1